MKALPYSWTVAPAADALWEQGLNHRLMRRAADDGSLGELEAIALQLGLIQRTLEPRLVRPQLVLALGDHGLATDGVPKPLGLDSTALAKRLCAGQLPLNTLARQHGIGLTLIDAGLSDTLPAHPALLTRKIAHGTRHARMGPAMSRDQALAAIRVGAELAQSLPGNALLCAGLGVGSTESAALVLARLTDTPVSDLLPVSSQRTSPARASRLLAAAQGALARHPTAREPVDVLACLGGFETAVLAGLMMAAAQARKLIVIDGLPAMAALMAASRLAPPVVDFCVFVRSQGLRAIDEALALFKARVVLELGVESIDGTSATLAWPLISAATVCISGQEATTGRDPLDAPGCMPEPTTLTDELQVQTEMRFLPTD